ncbi:hypothetical protein BDR06DRAFT_1039619 [Suillus hirtellus]|nr:hypothetical protein BDR06DRAFT_1039619 [Suillus hirtellus]
MWGSLTHNSRIERSWVEEIESDCHSFQAKWNAHPISGEGHDQSPNDMRLMGQLEHGLYADEGIHPDIIRQYYGTAGKPMHHAPHQTGAGHPSDEDPGGKTEDLQELPQLIAADHDAHFHHKPVHVPKHASPFNSATLYNTFHQAFTQV